MAPSYLGDAMLDRRQNMPVCVTSCMVSGDTTGCKSIVDYACLCKSPAFLDSVTSCWQSTCDAAAIVMGQEYAGKACAAFGVNLNTTISEDPANNTQTGPPINLYDDPVVYQKAFMNVQAIMSSVCAALFAVAIVLGILACRKRAKTDRETAQRSTWTGIGGTTLNGVDTKGGTQSRFGISRNAGITSRGGGVGLDSNFDITSMSTLRYGQSSYGGLNRDPMAPSLNRTGFTNRLTLGDMGEEEWEMSSKSSPDNEPETAVDSPTSSSTKMGASTVDLGEEEKIDGSTVELNAENHNGRAI